MGIPLPPVQTSTAALSKDLHKVIVLICSVHLLRQDLEIGQVNVEQVLEARPLDLHHHLFSSM